MFSWNSLASSMLQQMSAIWFLVPLPLSKSNLNTWKLMILLRQPVTSTWIKFQRVHSMFHSGQLQTVLWIYKCYVCGCRQKHLEVLFPFILGNLSDAKKSSTKLCWPYPKTVSHLSPLWPTLTSGALHHGINVHFTSQCQQCKKNYKIQFQILLSKCS